MILLKSALKGLIETWASPKFARWNAMRASKTNFMLLDVGMFNCIIFEEKNNFYMHVDMH